MNITLPAKSLYLYSVLSTMYDTYCITDFHVVCTYCSMRHFLIDVLPNLLYRRCRYCFLVAVKTVGQPNTTYR